MSEYIVMSKYRIEFTEYDENGGPARYAITLQAESKEEAETVFSYRKPLSWDVKVIESGGSE